MQILIGIVVIDKKELSTHRLCDMRGKKEGRKAINLDDEKTIHKTESKYR